MTRKITSLVALLLLCIMGASAQVVSELQGKAVAVGNALETFETNTWYFLHQAREGGNNGTAGTHSEVGSLPVTGGYTWDKGVGNKLFKSTIDDVSMDIDEPTPTATAAKFMVRILESEEHEGAYIIQFGTGNYIDENLNSSASKYDAVELNIYQIVAEGEEEGTPGHFGINKWNMANRLDNNGAGNSLAWWSEGELHALNGNNDWAIHEVLYGEVDEYETAITDALAVANEYYELAQEFVPGTEPGQYDEEALAALNAAIEELYMLDEPGGTDGKTLEDIAALKQAVLDAYAACIATRVYFTTPDGYYHIVSAMEWTNTVTIPAEEEDGEPTTEETHPTKAMFVNGSNAKWGNLEADDCTFLWKLEATPDHNFKITNAATDGGFNQIAQSQNVTMADTATAMRIEVASKNEEKIVVAITRAEQTGAFQFLHAGGHGGGAGVSGNLVGWSIGEEGTGATCWYLEPVSAEEAAAIIAAYEPIKNHDALVEKYHEMKADAAEKLEAAKDKYTDLDEETPLITDATQFSSEYTTTDTQCESIDEVYTYLLDGNASTYWHSRWEDGNVAAGTHYLQVEMPDTEVANAAIKFTRRAVANDHITVWGVYGSNDETLDKADWTELAVIETPFTSNTETLVSPVFPTGGNKYLRFYINNTYGSAVASTRGYGHVSEFQLYPAELGQRQPNQYAVLGAIATNLEAVLAAQADLEDEDVQIEEYNALKAAYDAFIAKFTDPAPLRAKLASLQMAENYFKTGNNVGEWPVGSAAVADFQNKMAAATTYDQAADYTPAQSEQWIADLDAAYEALPAAANQVSTGKWYNFRFGTEEEYEANNWAKTNGQALMIGETDYEGHAALFGKYLCVGTNEITDSVEVVTNAETGATQMRYVHTVETIAAEDVLVGNNIYMMEKEIIAEAEIADMAKFRFINVADTAYVIQNKATGLFLKAAGTSGAVTLSVHPTLFAAPKAIGFGQTVTAARTLNGANCNNLHIQRDNNTLVTWAAAEAGTNSGLFIEEAEDVAADYAAPTCFLEVQNGEYAAYCFASSMKCLDAEANMYTATLAGNELTLQPLADKKAEAGRPFILIFGTTDEYKAEPEEEDYSYAEFEHGTEFASEAYTSGALHGTFVSKKIGAGKVWCEGNTLAITKKSTSTVGANSAWIESDSEEGVDLEAALTIVISTEGVDNINTAISAVSKTGDIYTLDGKRVARGNVNTLQQLGRGIYIVNGHKVIVK